MRIFRLVAEHLTYANVVATLALFVALGGASYAVVNVPDHSVGHRQLKSGAVSTRNLSFPLGTTSFGSRGPIEIPKTACNTTLPPGSPLVACPALAQVAEDPVGTVKLRAPSNLELSAVVQLANDGPPELQASVTLALNPGGQRATFKIDGGQSLNVPLQALAYERAGTHSVSVTVDVSGVHYSEQAPGSLTLLSSSVVATALPKL